MLEYNYILYRLEYINYNNRFSDTKHAFTTSSQSVYNNNSSIENTPYKTNQWLQLSVLSPSDSCKSFFDEDLSNIVFVFVIEH